MMYDILLVVGTHVLYNNPHSLSAMSNDYIIAERAKPAQGHRATLAGARHL